MLYLDEIFHAATCQRVTQCDSTVICYTLNDKISYGHIQMFIWYKHQGRNYAFAKVKEFLVAQRNETNHIVMVKDQSDENSDKLITVDSIIHKMLCVDYSDSEVKYLCQLPNHQDCY